MFALWLASFSNIVNTGMKWEGGLPILDTDNLKIYFPTAEIITQLMGKISANLPTTEGLKTVVSVSSAFPSKVVDFVAGVVTSDGQTCQNLFCRLHWETIFSGRKEELGINRCLFRVCCIFDQDTW